MKRYQLSLDGQPISEDNNFSKLFKEAKALLKAGIGEEALIHSGKEPCDLRLTLAPPIKVKTK